MPQVIYIGGVFPLKEEAGGETWAENLEGWVGLSRVFSFTVFDKVFFKSVLQIGVGIKIHNEFQQCSYTLGL